MFAILEIVPPKHEKCFLKRIFQKIPTMEIERIALRGGAFFYSIKAYADKNGRIDEAYLKSVIGSSANRILLRENTTLPKDSTLQLFKPKLLPHMLFMNTALAFLRETTGKENRILGILDWDAHLLEDILAFAPYAKRVIVFTNNPKSYESTRAEMMHTYGLPLELANTLKKCDILLDPYYKVGEETFGLIHLHGVLPCSLCGEGVVLPKELNARCPSGTDPVLFLSALYEICNINGIEKLSFAKRIRFKSPVTIDRKA